MGKLEGKVALVTGAASGIGEAIARLFAQEGARVVVADIQVERGQAVAASIGGLFVKTDVTSPAEVEALVEAAAAQHGQIDVMVNNAGVAPRQMPLAEYTPEDLDRILSIHLKGVFYGMKYAIPVMLKNAARQRSSEQQGALNGAIINISSNAAIKAFARNSLYSAAKAGVLQLTRVAALEYAKEGIRVNAICPGITMTGMVQTAITSAGTEEAQEGRRRALEQAQPIPGIIPPAKIAAATLYLASDDASFVTGVVLPADAGSVL